MTRILAIGDIVGKAGRKILEQALPVIRSDYQPDFVVVNGENLAGGFGITKKLFDRLTEHLAIDCVTTGNHWHDKREIYDFREHTDRLVLPANMANVDEESRGLRILNTKSGIPVAVINLLGNAFMHGDNRCPFQTADRLISKIPEHVRVRIVDMHAEATSEKQAIAHFLSGKASLVYGTHSHVPSADERIIDKYTGFTTDLGLTGAYDSVIGIRKQAAIHRFLTKEKKRFEPATADPWLTGVIADIDDENGQCVQIKRLRLEGTQLS